MSHPARRSRKRPQRTVPWRVAQSADAARVVETLTGDELAFYHDMRAAMTRNPDRDLHTLYELAAVARQLRDRALDGRTTRGTPRRRVVNPEGTSLGKLNAALELPRGFLFALARLCDVWPQEEDYLRDVVRPAQEYEFPLSATHLLLLTNSLRSAEYSQLRARLIASCCRHQWTRDVLWQNIREARRQLNHL